MRRKMLVMLVEQRSRRNIDTKPFVRRRRHLFTALAIPALAISLTAFTQASSIGTQVSRANLVTNGNFEDLKVPGLSSVFGDRSSNPACIANGCDGQQVLGWDTGGLNIVWTPGTHNESDTNGAHSESGNFFLWGPSRASNNQLTPQCTLNGCGGNYLALDGDPVHQGAISQTISGLHVGSQYTVSFAWATAQQCCFSAPDGLTQMLTVGLCPVAMDDAKLGCTVDTQMTDTLHTPEHGALPWEPGRFTFTASSSTEALTFLATGTPTGDPPFVLLDGVSMEQQQQAVPEPNASTLLGLAFAALAGLAYLRPKWLCLQD